MTALCTLLWVILGDVPQFIGLHMNMNEKIKRKQLKYLPLLLINLVFLILALILSTDDALVRIGFTIAYFLYAIILFEEKTSYKLIVSCVVVLLSTISDLIIEMPSYALLGHVTKPSDANIESIIIMLLFSMLFMVMLVLFTRLNKHNKTMIDRTAILFFLLPLSNILMVLCLSTQFQIPAFWSLVRTLLVISAFFIMGLSLFLLYRAMNENYRAKQSQMKLAQLEYNQRLSESYFENITQSAQMLMKYKHDFNNMITTALHMVNSNDESTKKQGVQLLEQIKEKNSETAIPFYCKNPVVNTILFDKSSRAKTEGIDFTTDVKLPERLDIELTDLCSIFSNLIDNGLRSACGSDDNRLELKAWCDTGYMFVRTKNYPDDDFELPSQDKQFDLAKPSQHGYGLSILKELAEKYSGSFEIKKQGSAVEAMCCVSLPETA